MIPPTSTDFDNQYEYKAVDFCWWDDTRNLEIDNIKFQIEYGEIPYKTL